MTIFLMRYSIFLVVLALLSVPLVRFVSSSVRWRNPLFIASKTEVTTGVCHTTPTVRELEQLAELVTYRVHISDILVGSGEGWEGCWLIKGDALISVDMRKPTIIRTDENHRQIVIGLPRPVVLSARVDHPQTKKWSLRRRAWASYLWGDRDKLTEEMMTRAQQTILEAAGTEEHIEEGKRRAEEILRSSSKLAGWDVRVEWRD